MQQLMDTLGIEPKASRMLSGCDTTTPCAQCVCNISETVAPEKRACTCWWNDEDKRAWREQNKDFPSMSNESPNKWQLIFGVLCALQSFRLLFWWQLDRPPWPNGQGVGLLIRRLRVRVPQGVTLGFTVCEIHIFLLFPNFTRLAGIKTLISWDHHADLHLTQLNFSHALWPRFWPISLSNANFYWAHGVVVSHPLRMRKALGSNPNVSIFALPPQNET